MSSSWPENVGIIAVELYFPHQYVDQSALEKYDNVSAGKYKIGLGQDRMGFCNDREDIHSLSLTVVKNLLVNYQIKPEEIGRLEVGTETIIDKSKSVKTVLMELFEPYGVTDIEGIDTTNACFGGTAALFNAISWIESSAWNGRYALVVAADIAVYAKGPARPTGGVGAVAMLLGPNAPLVFDRGLRGYFCKHSYDFYKPDLSSEYPIVDGKLSVQCYLEALDKCYQIYCKKAEKQLQIPVNISNNFFDGLLFHTPYCKLVQKSVGRLALNDFCRLSTVERSNLSSDLKQFVDVQLDQTYLDREVEKAFLQQSANIFKSKTEPSLWVAKQIGNMYTSSLYGSLISYLLNKTVSELEGNRIALFSYGSGLASALFSLRIKENSQLDLQRIKKNVNKVRSLMEKRVEVAPNEFEATLELRQHGNHTAPYQPKSDVSKFFPGTFYLVNIDEKYRRFYEIVSNDKSVETLVNGSL